MEDVLEAERLGRSTKGSDLRAKMEMNCRLDVIRRKRE